MENWYRLDWQIIQGGGYSVLALLLFLVGSGMVAPTAVAASDAGLPGCNCPTNLPPHENYITVGKVQPDGGLKCHKMLCKYSHPKECREEIHASGRNILSGHSEISLNRGLYEKVPSRCDLLVPTLGENLCECHVDDVDLYTVMVPGLNGLERECRQRKCVDPKNPGSFFAPMCNVKMTTREEYPEEGGFRQSIEFFTGMWVETGYFPCPTEIDSEGSNE